MNRPSIEGIDWQDGRQRQAADACRRSPPDYRVSLGPLRRRSGERIEAGGRVFSQAFRLFNRPFLVYMQKRGAERPFFVMWVDNAELLVRK